MFNINADLSFFFHCWRLMELAQTPSLCVPKRTVRWRFGFQPNSLVINISSRFRTGKFSTYRRCMAVSNAPPTLVTNFTFAANNQGFRRWQIVWKNHFYGKSVNIASCAMRRRAIHRLLQTLLMRLFSGAAKKTAGFCVR